MRTWSYSLAEDLSTLQSASEDKKRPKKHVINLYHDTITGATSNPLSRASIDSLVENKTFTVFISWKLYCTFSMQVVKIVASDEYFYSSKKSLNGSSK